MLVLYVYQLKTDAEGNENVSVEKVSLGKKRIRKRLRRRKKWSPPKDIYDPGGTCIVARPDKHAGSGKRIHSNRDHCSYRYTCLSRQDESNEHICRNTYSH